MAVSHASIACALGSTDAEERRQATAELLRVPLDDALPLLLLALADDDWRVRKEATLVGRSFDGAPALVLALVSAFRPGDNVGFRNAAVDVLAGAGRAATDAILGELPFLDADGRKLAVETLGRARDPASITALDAALGESDDNVRATAIEAIAGLGSLEPDRVTDILLRHLGDRDPLVRLVSLEGLTALGVAIPWERLSPLLGDAPLRAAALAAAALVTSPEAAQALVHELSRARGGAFQQALKALARMAEGPLADVVVAQLRAEGPDLGRRLLAAAVDPDRDNNSEARRAMALELSAAAAADGVVDAAIEALAEEQLVEAAQRALVLLGAGQLDVMIERLNQTAAGPLVPPEARAVLVDVIAEIGRRVGDTAAHAALAALRSAARDSDKEIAVRALLALSRLGEAEDLDIAAEQTLSSSPPVASAAEGTLAALVSRFPAAARTFADRIALDQSALVPAAIAVGALGAVSVFEERDGAFLAHLATAGDKRARRAAVEAVCELRSRDDAAQALAIEVLGLALADEEHEVQLAAARALGRLCAPPNPVRASEVLDLVQRSGTPDLIAATVRAMGDGLSPIAHRPSRSMPPRRPESRPPSPSSEPDGPGRASNVLSDQLPNELVEAIASFARDAPAVVAIAAIDALAQADRAGALDAIAALDTAQNHPDVAVVKAALVKLASTPAGLSAVVRGLDHPSPSVRRLAVEMLADSRSEDARERLGRLIFSEADPSVKGAILHALGPMSSSSLHPASATGLSRESLEFFSRSPESSGSLGPRKGGS